MAKRYAVLIEKGPSSYGASVPDLPGCVAVAETRQEVEKLIQEAIEFHLEGMREDGEPIPEPTTDFTYVTCHAVGQFDPCVSVSIRGSK